MPQREPVSEETKKKISEALTKNKPEEKPAPRIPKVPKNPVARGLFNSFQKSMNKTRGLRAKRDALREQKKALPRGKGSRAARKKLSEQIKSLRAELKTGREERKVIKTKAREIKRIIRAQKKQKKAKIRIKKYKKMNKKVEARQKALESKLKSETDPKRKAKLKKRIKRSKERLKRISERLTKQDTIINDAGAVIASGGKKEKTGILGIFNFNAIPGEHLALNERAFKPFRPLTFQEERTGMESLNTNFNQIQVELEQSMADITQLEINKILDKNKKAIETKDIIAISALSFMALNKIKLAVDKGIKSGYEVGKVTASNELSIKRPSTPTKQTQVMNAEIKDISEQYVNEIEQTAKDTIRNSILAGASTVAILAATREVLQNKSSQVITNISGLVVGQNINRGRKQVFFDNLDKIGSFERSEVLDKKTCNMCLSLDGRVVKASDPMAQMDIVHSHCRGVWIPIFPLDKRQPKITGIPASLAKQFDTVDGKPIVNKFKQIKKPINTKDNKKAQAEIKDRLQK